MGGVAVGTTPAERLLRAGDLLFILLLGGVVEGLGVGNVLLRQVFPGILVAAGRLFLGGELGTVEVFLGELLNGIPVELIFLEVRIDVHPDRILAVEVDHEVLQSRFLWLVLFGLRVYQVDGEQHGGDEAPREEDPAVTCHALFLLFRGTDKPARSVAAPWSHDMDYTGSMTIPV